MSSPAVASPAAAPRGLPQRLTRAARRVAIHAVPVTFTAWLIGATAGTRLWAADFTHSFLPAAALLLHGHSPYPPLSAPPSGSAFVYPPLLAIALLPFAVAPSWIASAVFVVLVFAALAGTLLALGVRDLRCYSIALLWPAVVATVQTASISLALALAVALAWRWRAMPRRQVAVVALAIVAKLFLWPLLIWLAAIGGLRRGVAAGAAATAVGLGSWMAIGFAGLDSYVPLLRRLGAAEGPTGYTFSHLSAAAGLGAGAGTAVAYATAACLLAAVWVTGRRGHAAESLALCLAAALIASPIVWLHYFALLLVPVALAAPTLSRLWLLPCVALLAGPAVGPNHRPVAVLVVLAVAAMTTGLAIRSLRISRTGVASPVGADPT
ncbi:MAG TPA: glycosyltransferase 87 family protein [Gaiellales bacterium]|nr:glycosyltransferase 87 family protein [Gaiellales bacterium]